MLLDVAQIYTNPVKVCGQVHGHLVLELLYSLLHWTFNCQIDRLLDWHRNPTSGIRDTLKRQKANTRSEFDGRVGQVVTEFAEKVN